MYFGKPLVRPLVRQFFFNMSHVGKVFFFVSHVGEDYYFVFKKTSMTPLVIEWCAPKIEMHIFPRLIDINGYNISEKELLWLKKLGFSWNQRHILHKENEL